MKRRSLQELLAIWNRATNPAALRSDHEHHRNRQLAHAAMRQIAFRYVEGRDYRETDHTGRLVTTR
jgi:hypothetical protein